MTRTYTYTKIVPLPLVREDATYKVARKLVSLLRKNEVLVEISDTRTKNSRVRELRTVDHPMDLNLLYNIISKDYRSIVIDKTKIRYEDTILVFDSKYHGSILIKQFGYEY